jgi:hypothetical protein
MILFLINILELIKRLLQFILNIKIFIVIITGYFYKIENLMAYDNTIFILSILPIYINLKDQGFSDVTYSLNKQIFSYLGIINIITHFFNNY